MNTHVVNMHAVDMHVQGVVDMHVQGVVDMHVQGVVDIHVLVHVVDTHALHSRKHACVDGQKVDMVIT